jgi:hypothetical protein
VHQHDLDTLKALARMAPDAIVKETQDESQHWAVALRQFDPMKSPPPPKAELHGLLRNAANSFRRRHPQLAKKLDSYLGIVDSM